VRIILTGIREPSILADCLKEKYIPFDFIPLDRLIGRLKDSSKTSLIADAIVCVVHPDSTPKSVVDYQRLTLASSVVKFVKELRSLRSFHALNDGRKWAMVPVVVIVNHFLMLKRFENQLMRP
jgi:hypothetical protein